MDAPVSSHAVQVPPAPLPPTRVGVVGLGLIGGSFAKAYSDAGIEVFGADIDERSLAAALAEGAVVGRLDESTVADCDLVLVALYPGATVEWVERMAPLIGKDALVIDCGGVKRAVCAPCFAAAERAGFVFGRPSHGRYAQKRFPRGRAPIFSPGQPMVLVPRPVYDPSVLARAQAALAPVGFGSFSIATPERHDEIIAYTSQLAHVVSSAFIKSPSAQKHRGFSAGSYKDLTRVAELNADMWTELFMVNADNLVFELDGVIRELERYRAALHDGDAETLHTLLEEGSKAKLSADGRYADAQVVRS